MKRLITAPLILAAAVTLSWAQPETSPVVAQLLGRIEVQGPIHHENLTLFPLVGSGQSTTSFLTLEQALSSGRVQVQEKGSGEVNLVRMRNIGKTFVFGMAGEIVSGAKQDRMLQHDILLPPNSGWLDVPVYCTEQGRWHGTSMSFETKGQLVAGSVREAASRNQSQTEVWAEVDAVHAKVGAAAPSHAFARVYEDANVQERAKPYVEQLTGLVSRYPNAQGVLVAVGSRVVCVDLFGSTGLFRKMWPKLLRSYVIDALSEKPEGTLSRFPARQFIRTAAAASLSGRNTVGAGQLYHLSSPNASGSALLFRAGLVHLDLFPEPEWYRGTGDENDVPRLDIRRTNSRH